MVCFVELLDGLLTQKAIEFKFEEENKESDSFDSSWSETLVNKIFKQGEDVMLSLFSVKIYFSFFSISYTKQKCFCPLCCLDLICWMSYLPWKKILLTVFCGRLVFCGRWMCIGYYLRLSLVSYIFLAFVCVVLKSGLLVTF